MAPGNTITTRLFWQDSPEPESRAGGPNTGNAPTGQDDLFNYDTDMNDVSRPTNGQSDNVVAAARLSRNDADMTLGLGIDEEVKVRKRRAPIAKLDEERLLSANGIPKLRRIAKDRMKFKGKGHEFSDVSRLLNVYQLWLDELFPKAKFTDGLAMIEKLGHKKRLQVMRKAWIDEEKPQPAEEDVGNDFTVNARDRTPRQEERSQEHRKTVSESHRDAPQTSHRGAIEEDIYAEPSPVAEIPSATRFGSERNRAHISEPPEDELDALLAEHEAEQTSAQDRPRAAPPPPLDNDFADDEEALAGLW